ncbi:hypothetical protein P3W45_001145 [Vairimorpha bombi]
MRRGLASAELINEIKTRFLHKKLIEGIEHELVSVKESTLWLRKGNNTARNEGKFCFLQDRNVFFNESSICPHCNQAKRTVDHVATRYDTMRSLDACICFSARNTRLSNQEEAKNPLSPTSGSQLIRRNKS